MRLCCTPDGAAMVHDFLSLASGNGNNGELGSV